MDKRFYHYMDKIADLPDATMGERMIAASNLVIAEKIYGYEEKVEIICNCLDQIQLSI